MVTRPSYLSPPPVLNRLVTVRGARTRGENVPKVWVFDNPGYGQVNGVQVLGGQNVRLSPPLTANGTWTCLNSLAQPTPTPTTAGDLVNIAYLGYSSLLTENGADVETPRPQVVTGITPPKAFLYDDDGNEVLAWNLNANNYLHGLESGGQLINTYLVSVANGALTGDDYTLAGADDGFPNGSIGFEASKVSTQTIGSFDKRVWARITESGQQAGILSLSAGDITVTEVFASILTRFDPEFEVAETVIDDRRREWRVSDSHSILDRRYMQIELTRTVAT